MFLLQEQTRLNSQFADLTAILSTAKLLVTTCPAPKSRNWSELVFIDTVQLQDPISRKLQFAQHVCNRWSKLRLSDLSRALNLVDGWLWLLHFQDCDCQHSLLHLCFHLIQLCVLRNSLTSIIWHIFGWPNFLSSKLPLLYDTVLDNATI